MSVGYSGTPLATKLGIKDGSSVYVLNAPASYKRMLAPLPPGVSFVKSADRAHVIHVFTIEKRELQAQLVKLRATMSQDSALWVSWPKKASGVATDISEDVIRAVCLPLGLVDIKVCAVDETWSGLKLVIRKELRNEAVALNKVAKKAKSTKSKRA
ncbi:MAG: DUF3052 domain-containing protein [Povalibacter sp.]